MCRLFHYGGQLKLPSSKEDLKNIQNIWKLDRTYLELV